MSPMTEQSPSPTTERLVVTQADREVAAAICRWAYPGMIEAGTAIIAGKHDRHPVVQIIADRTASLQAEIAELREALGALEAAGTKTLGAMDRYNTENGTHIVGPSLLRLGIEIANARNLLNKDKSNG